MTQRAIPDMRIQWPIVNAIPLGYLSGARGAPQYRLRCCPAVHRGPPFGFLNSGLNARANVPWIVWTGGSPSRVETNKPN